MASLFLISSSKDEAFTKKLGDKFQFNSELSTVKSTGKHYIKEDVVVVILSPAMLKVKFLWRLGRA